MYVEHHGEMIFNNHTTGDFGKLILKERSWSGIFCSHFIIQITPFKLFHHFFLSYSISTIFTQNL